MDATARTVQAGRRCRGMNKRQSKKIKQRKVDVYFENKYVYSFLAKWKTIRTLDKVGKEVSE